MENGIHWSTAMQGKLVYGLESLGLPLLTRENFDSFEFNFKETFIMDIKFPLFTIFLYCLGIPLLQKFMENRKPPPLKYLLIVHNFFLAAFSFYLVLLLGSTILSVAVENGMDFQNTQCNFDFYMQKGTLSLIYYINHLLKYYELLDTIFLALKKKPIGFLHAYHHPATLALTWTQVVDSTGCQWVPIWLNLIVHSVMYLYYLMSLLKIKMPWKYLVTILQILQFVIDLASCIWPTLVIIFTNECQGSLRAAMVGNFIIGSYLFLFVDFYNETYGKKKKQKMQEKKDR